MEIPVKLTAEQIDPFQAHGVGIVPDVLTKRTEFVRWSMDLRCQPTGVPTGRLFHPDFVVRSAADPDSVYYEFDEWNRRWVEALEASAGYQAHRSIPIEERSPKS